MKVIRAVLLDMGGVLLNMGEAPGLPAGALDWRGREALVHYLRQRGGRVALEDVDRLLLSPWRTEYARRYETGREARWEPHLKRLRRMAGSRAHAVDLLGCWFEPYAERVVPMEGTRSVLEELDRRGLRMTLVSNVPLPGKLYTRILVRFDLAEFLPLSYFSYDHGHRKPSPAMLRAALQELDVSPDQAVMVGDRRGSDIAAGRAAGTFTVWLRSKYDRGPRPDIEIDELTDLPSALESLGRKSL